MKKNAWEGWLVRVVHEAGVFARGESGGGATQHGRQLFSF